MIQRQRVISIDCTSDDPCVDIGAFKTNKRNAASSIEQNLPDQAQIDTEGDTGKEAGSTCIICMDAVGDRGSHRASCLKCGHIFGKSCIVEWLKQQKRCPQCNKRSKCSDLIDLYNLPKVQSADPALVDDLEKQLQEESRVRKEAQSETEKLKKESRRLEQETEKLRQESRRQEQELYNMKKQLLNERPLEQESRDQRQLPHAARNLRPIQAFSGIPQSWQQQQQQLQKGISSSTNASLCVASPWVTQQPGQSKPSHTPLTPPISLAHQSTVDWLRSQVPISETSTSWNVDRSGQGPLPPSYLPDNGMKNYGGYINFQRGLDPPLSSYAPPHCGPGPPSSSYTAPPVRPEQIIFEHKQELGSSGMHIRCFDMHVPSALLLTVAEDIQGPVSSRDWFISKLNVMCPEAPSKMKLPGSVGMVRDIRYNPDTHMAAIATQGMGLMLTSTDSDSVVSTYNLDCPVWSCSWGRRAKHIIYAGLKDGRLVKIDIRVAGGQGLRGCEVIGQTGPMPSLKMPLHTVLALGDDFGIPPSFHSSYSDGSVTTMGVECLVAGAGLGVWALPPGPGAHLQPLVAPATEGRGYTCESLVTDHASGSVAISWRPPPLAAGGTGSGTLPNTARHRIFQVQQSVASVNGHINGLFKGVAVLSGHSSSMVLTRGAFVPTSPRLLLDGDTGWFASADEDTRRPLLWSLKSGHIVQRLRAHNEPITQLLSGSSSSIGTLLACCSSGEVNLYTSIA